MHSYKNNSLNCNIQCISFLFAVKQLLITQLLLFQYFLDLAILCWEYRVPLCSKSQHQWSNPRVLLSVTSRTGPTVERPRCVVAGNNGVGGARFCGKVTLVHIGHTGRVPCWSLPAILTDAFIFRLFIGGEKSVGNKIKETQKQQTFPGHMCELGWFSVRLPVQV